MTRYQKDLTEALALELRGLHLRGEYGGRAIQIRQEIANLTVTFKATSTSAYYRCRTGGASLDLDHAIDTWTPR